MKKTAFICFGLLLLSRMEVMAQSNPLYTDAHYSRTVGKDWLINAEEYKAEIYETKDRADVILDNGLIRRSFRLAPDLVCYDYSNLRTGQQLIRAVEPEAWVNINGTDYAVGGLDGQREKAYLLTEWLPSLKKKQDGFYYVSHEMVPLSAPIKANHVFWSSNSSNPKGKAVVFRYQHPKMPGITVQVHYEIYDKLPVIRKWVTIKNQSGKSLTVNRVVHEVLSLVEEESAVVGETDQMLKQSGIYFETNYAYNNAMQYRLSDQTTHWETDSAYTSQVNYDLKTPVRVKIYPAKVSDIALADDKVFESVKTYELLQDSYDRERRGLAVRRMYRLLSPWVTANPIFMHLVSKNDDDVRAAIDQAAAVGYEAVILSFGSHLNMEENTAANHAKWKKLATYAKNKGVRIGGYTLFSSRKISAETDVIDPKTGKPGGAFFGNAPCMASEWGLKYAEAIVDFFKQTGFDILEMDGPYPGDVCASHNHPGHKGLEDSQWAQMNIQKKIFHELNAMDVYINAPDWYFLDGTNKIGLGYREVNFALSRAQQKILNRQNIYDGTWERTPSMSWGFVPLTAYHGGGADAVIEPLDEHLEDYRQLMVQYYAAGVQACYRGPRLYDTDRTKRMVTEVVDWYKKYRTILNADVVHLRRPDGRDWDGILHVDPQGKDKGLAVLYNPTKSAITRTVRLPVYYTGLSKTVTLSEQEGKARQLNVDAQGMVAYTVAIPAESYTWLMIR
ncbi:alpha-galactosidase [Sphingobacterium spiritivorum]|uniref:alpha-galactosidase n=1 Tax=Sphingobacterium spiritivorum TaxID=258 RepID=UPI003DA24071